MQLVATIVGNTANVKASDIVITNTYSKANIAVKSVSVNAKDKTQVTVETYVAMNDGKDYTVTLADVTKTITVTDGKVATLAITPETVVVPAPDYATTHSNDIKVVFEDANKVQLGEATRSTVNAVARTLGFVSADFDVDATNNGYMSGDALLLYKAGNTAKVKVVAHTGKYDATAQEQGNVSAEATVTGVAETTVATGWNVKIGTTTTATKYADVKETTIAAGDSAAYAYAQIALSNDKTQVPLPTVYDFTTSDADVMTVSTTTSTVADALAIQIHPYKAGSAYIIVKDKKTNAVVTTLPVTVGATRKPTTLTLDKNTFDLSSATATNVVVKATLKDQYGAPVTINGRDVKLQYKLASATTFTDAAADTITLLATPFASVTADTTFVYNVQVGNLKSTIVVNVKKAGTAVTYDMVLDKESVDAIIKADAGNNTTVTATVYGYDANGVVASDATSDYTISVSKDGNPVTTDAVGTISGSTVNVNKLTDGTQMATGTYLVTAVSKTDSSKKFTKTFTITNTQPAMSVALTDTSVTSGASLASILTIKYDGKEYKGTDTGVTVAEGSSIVSTAHFAKVTVSITIATDKVVKQEVTLGKTVTIKAN